MTNTKEKPGKEQRVQIRTRQPGPVQPSGFSQLRRHANLDNVDTVAELLGLSVQSTEAVDPDQTRTSAVPDPDQTRTSTRLVPEVYQSPEAPELLAPQSPALAPKVGARTNRPKARGSAAPDRDFGRVANSITRDALPAGAFPGSSKKIYDVLYHRSRAAVTPVRSVRATRRELMTWTGIKDVKTVNAHVKKLIDAGLIIRTKLAGEHEGSIYEVLLPEEVNQYQTQTRTRPVPDPYQGGTGAVPESNQKTVSDQYQKTVRAGSGNPIDSIDTSGAPKTSFKTKDEKLDDEALALFAAAMGKATLDLTGKSLSPSEAQRWAEVADVLVTELRIAAGRTTVSSVPAFLAEHLRRRLFKKDQKQLANEAIPEVSAAPDARRVDASQCPDCFGTGMHYPEGYDKGVARCRHEKLTAPAASSAPTPASAAQPPTDGDLIEMAIGFLHQGLEIEAIGQLLAASIDAEHWPRIRAAALERYEREREQTRPPTTA